MKYGRPTAGFGHKTGLQLRQSLSETLVSKKPMPVYLQILTYMQRWGLWAAHIQDEERRKELIEAIAGKMENVWLVGMEQGHIPQTLDQVNAQGEESTGHRARPKTQHQRSRRAMSPSREVVIKTTSKGRPRYSITVGELEEAGLSVKEVEQRMLSVETAADSLLPHLDRVIIPRDWHGVLPVTACNSLGRDLETYCLWEMQNLRRELHTLQELKQRFKSASQVKNTQIRIDAAKALYDQYAAVASLLHEKKGCRFENASPESEPDGGASTISPDAASPQAEPTSSVEPSSEHDTPNSSPEREHCASTSSDQDEAARPRSSPQGLKLRFFRQQPCRRVITLKTKPEFQPEEYSARTVNKVRGFRWRYLHASTVAERAF
ncbi:hypothetical protein DV735_g4806, partial [Chaetothyriales sp. CBS 134920]